jgi:hypothetical protein
MQESVSSSRSRGIVSCILCREEMAMARTPHSPSARPVSSFTIVVRGKDIRERYDRRRARLAPVGGGLRLVAVVDLEQTVATATASEAEGATEVEALAATAVTLRSFPRRVTGSPRRRRIRRVRHDALSRIARERTSRYSRGAGSRRSDAGDAWEVLEFDGHVGPRLLFGLLWWLDDDPVRALGRSRFGSVHRRSVPFLRYVAILRVEAPRRRRGRTTSADGARRARILAAGRRGVRKERDGFVRFLVIADGARRRLVDGERFRLAIGRRLGWDAIPSPRYSVSRVAGGFELVGSGHGHGIGLCVSGAVAMARGGAHRDTIIARYFPKCRVTSLW